MTSSPGEASEGVGEADDLAGANESSSHTVWLKGSGCKATLQSLVGSLHHRRRRDLPAVARRSHLHPLRTDPSIWILHSLRQTGDGARAKRHAVE